MSLRIPVILMELTARLTNVVSPGPLTSLVLRLLALVQVGPHSTQPLRVARRGAVARAGLAAGAAHQARTRHGQTLTSPHVQGGGGEGGVEGVHLHVDVTPSPVTGHR